MIVMLWQGLRLRWARLGWWWRRNVAFHVGYHIGTDCPFSVTVCLGERPIDYWKPGFLGQFKYRFIAQVYWDWPKLLWAHESWVMGEPGYVTGLPVPRRGVRSSAWTGREWHLRAVAWYRGGFVRRFDD